jgi:hypothetical protein
VLFVANSLATHAAIPERVEKLANAMGRPVRVRTIAMPDASLGDHWLDGRALAALAEGTDVIVLQQGPSERPQAAAALRRDVGRFAREAKRIGARVALVMAWPASDRAADFPAVIRAHREAAVAGDAILLPVGEALLRASSAARLRLYGDGHHPSSLGADLAALTIYLGLFPAGPQEFDEAFVARMARALDLPAAHRDLLVDAATRAIDEPLALR